MCTIKKAVSVFKVSVTSSILDQWTALKKKKKKTGTHITHHAT